MVAPLASNKSVVAIFSGAQLFALGIMGEYLARIHQRMMERPAYTVAARVGEPGGAATGGSGDKGAVP